MSGGGGAVIGHLKARAGARIGDVLSFGTPPERKL